MYTPNALIKPQGRLKTILEAGNAVVGAVRLCPPRFDVRPAKAALFSGCESHPAQLLRPETIGAGMEEMKWLKPWVPPGSPRAPRGNGAPWRRCRRVCPKVMVGTPPPAEPQKIEYGDSLAAHRGGGLLASPFRSAIGPHQGQSPSVARLPAGARLTRSQLGADVGVSHTNGNGLLLAGK